jgi:predicted helicase
MLLDLLANINSWSELESRIADLPTEQQRGEAFEEFCQAFFRLDPVFSFKEVYRQKEIPLSILKQLGYPGIQDIGIDGLAISHDNKLTAYQCKFRSDRNHTPSLRELSTFFTMSDKADWRITITNTNNLPTSINERTRHNRILSDRLDQLDKDFFDQLRIYLSKKIIAPRKPKEIRQHQQEVIKEAIKHFQENTRGQLILPCGTGKTLAALWIAQKLGGNRILVMVPSLALLSQTLREWANNTTLKPFRYLCLCSDTTVDLGNDSPIEHLYEMDIKVSTDVHRTFLNSSTKNAATNSLRSILHLSIQQSPFRSHPPNKNHFRHRHL